MPTAVERFLTEAGVEEPKELSVVERLLQQGAAVAQRERQPVPWPEAVAPEEPKEPEKPEEPAIPVEVVDEINELGATNPEGAEAIRWALTSGRASPEDVSRAKRAIAKSPGAARTLGRFAHRLPYLTLVWPWAKMGEAGEAIADPSGKSPYMRAAGKTLGEVAELASYAVPGLREARIFAGALTPAAAALPESVRPMYVPEAEARQVREHPVQSALHVAALALFKYGPKGLSKLGMPRAAKAVGPGALGYLTASRARSGYQEAKAEGASETEAVAEGVRAGGTAFVALLGPSALGKRFATTPGVRAPHRLREPVPRVGEPELGARRAREVAPEEWVRAPRQPERLRAMRERRIQPLAEKVVTGAKEFAVAKEIEKARERRPKPLRRPPPMPGERLAPEMVPPKMTEAQILKKMAKISIKPLSEHTEADSKFLEDVEAGRIAGRPLSQWEAVQHKVPPGMPGGVTGQPPLKPTTKKQLGAIHVLRKATKVVDTEYRRMVSEATGGRTSSAGQLSNKEVGRVLGALRTIGEPVVKPPARILGEAKAAKKILRRPLSLEVKESEYRVGRAINEIKARRPIRYPETPGQVPKLGLATRLRRTALGQLLTTEQTGYETKVEMIAGRKGVAHDTLMERPRRARAKAASIAISGDEYARKSMAENSITRGVKKIHAEKLTSVMLSDGRLVKAQPSRLADAVGLWTDAKGREALIAGGFTLRENASPRFLTNPHQDIALIKQHLKARFPKVLSKLDDDIMWYRQIGAPLMATEFWKETGERLDIRNDYYSIKRDIRLLRGMRVEQLSPREQLQRWVTEETSHMSKKPAPSLKGRGVKAEPVLRGIPILKKRTGGAAPVLLQDIYTKFFAHTRSVAQYAGKATAVRDLELLLHNPGFQKAVRERFPDGEKMLNSMRKHVTAFAGLDWQPQGTLSRAVNWLLRKTTIGTLGLKPQIAAYQTISYANARVEIPGKHWRAGLAGTHAVTDAEINKYFPELKQRFEGGGHLIMTPSLTTGVQEQVNTSYFGPKKLGLEKIGLWPIHKMDEITVRNIAGASKSWAKADGFKGEQMLVEANKRTMQILDRTQPTWDPLTMATLQLEARKSPLKKSLVLFTSQANKNLNMATRAVSEYRTGKRSITDKAKLISKVAVPTIINATMVYGVGEGWFRLVGYDKEKSHVDHVSGVLDRMFGGYLVVAPIISNVKAQLVDRLGKKRASIFLEPRHNVLTEAVDDIPEVIGIWTEVIENAITGERAGPWRTSVTGEKYKVGPKKFDKNIIRAIQRSTRAMSRWFGLPVAGAEQIVRPLLLGRRKK